MKFKEFLNEMANLNPEMTGIPFTIWVSVGLGVRHGPRIKVSKGPKFKKDDHVTITIGKIPIVIGDGISQDDLAQISQWINLNKPTLLQFWENEISSTTLKNNIKKVEN